MMLSLEKRSDAETGGDGEVICQLPVSELVLGVSLREGGVQLAHVRTFVQVDVGAWPPIVVRLSGSETRVVDGYHRVAAARELGLVTIAARVFVGGPDDAVIESVRLNAHHGLPLTLRERERAAVLVLEARPDWSDRRLAALCGLSHRTVAGLRRGPCPSGSIVQLDNSCGSVGATRVGRDGRRRPLDLGATRDRIAAALTTESEVSLRAIASKVRASPETVRKVREQLRVEAGPAALIDRHVAREPASPQPSGTSEAAVDAAFCSTEERRCFAEWFDKVNVTDLEWEPLVDRVPLSRVYEIGEEARRRSASWLAFARAIEARAH